MLLRDEIIVFSGPVEERALRRRASRLIPITVSPLKPKHRQLILTSRRLVCVKQRARGVLSIKCELLIRPPKNGSTKDKNHIIGVESKTPKEFVVMTVSRFVLPPSCRWAHAFAYQSGKSQTYAAAHADLASSWIDHICAALGPV